MTRWRGGKLTTGNALSMAIGVRNLVAHDPPTDEAGWDRLAGALRPLIVTASYDKTARVWDAQTGQPLTEPMKHGHNLQSAQFSPDGKRIVTASDDNTARVWDVAPSQPRLPDWLLPLAEAIAGQRLNKENVLEPTQRGAGILNEVRMQLDRAPDNDDWVIWGRWFLADPATRTISPFSKTTVPEYIENRIKEHTAESLDEAEKAASGNAELLQRIAEARKTLK